MIDPRFANVRLLHLLAWVVLGSLVAGGGAAAAQHYGLLGTGHLETGVTAIAFMTVYFGAGWLAARSAGLGAGAVYGEPVTRLATLERPLMIVLPLLLCAGLSAAATFGLLESIGGEYIKRLTSERSSFGDARGPARVVLFIAVCVVAPLVEEFLFRGVLLRRIAATRGPVQGIVISALVFGILHPILPFGATALGLVYGVIVVATGSVWITVVMHAAHNSILMLGAFGASGREPDTKTLAVAGLPTWLPEVAAALGAVAFGIIVWMLLRPYRDRLPRQGAVGDLV